MEKFTKASGEGISSLAQEVTFKLLVEELRWQPKTSLDTKGVYLLLAGEFVLAPRLLKPRAIVLDSTFIRRSSESILCLI
jgi:hypothetical protein